MSSKYEPKRSPRPTWIPRINSTVVSGVIFTKITYYPASSTFPKEFATFRLKFYKETYDGDAKEWVLRTNFIRIVIKGPHAGYINRNCGKNAVITVTGELIMGTNQDLEKDYKDYIYILAEKADIHWAMKHLESYDSTTEDYFDDEIDKALEGL